MSTQLITILDVVIVLAAMTAAVFWFWASTITVPDNIDTFVNVLQRIGRLNALAAASAGVAATCGAIVFWFGRG